MDDRHSLDNPAWAALTGPQSEFAVRTRRAARYLPDISPLAAVADTSPASTADLVSLLEPGESIALLNSDVAHPRLDNLGEVEVAQWTCDDPVVVDRAQGPPLVTLGADDGANMYALAKATDPGPFERRTYLLGDYVGFRDGGVLTAMTGERISLPGYCEISGVCTAAGYGGRGYAQRLVSEIAQRQQARDVTPFLHVRRGSPAEAAANRVYQKLGFRQRAVYVMRIYRCLAPSADGS